MNTVISNMAHAKDVIEKVLSYLGVDGVTVTVSVNNKFLNMVMTEDYELSAATFPTAMGKAYNIYLRSSDVRDIILCHEAVHVSQYADGRLTLGGNGLATWMGLPYSKGTPYRSRPWEIEAFGLERQLLKKYRNHNYHRV